MRALGSKTPFRKGNRYNHATKEGQRQHMKIKEKGQKIEKHNVRDKGGG